MTSRLYCPYCNKILQVVDVDYEGNDILGCNDCDDWKQDDNGEDIEFYI